MIEPNPKGEVWVFAEQEDEHLSDTSLELCGKARELADPTRRESRRGPRGLERPRTLVPAHRARRGQGLLRPRHAPRALPHAALRPRGLPAHHQVQAADRALRRDAAGTRSGAAHRLGDARGSHGGLQPISKLAHTPTRKPASPTATCCTRFARRSAGTSSPPSSITTAGPKWRPSAKA